MGEEFPQENKNNYTNEYKYKYNKELKVIKTFYIWLTEKQIFAMLSVLNNFRLSL